MNEPFVEIEIEDSESFLPEEQTLTWSNAFEGYAPKCLSITLILGVILLIAFLIWFGIEHVS